MVRPVIPNTIAMSFQSVRTCMCDCDDATIKATIVCQYQSSHMHAHELALKPHQIILYLSVWLRVVKNLIHSPHLDKHGSKRKRVTNCEEPKSNLIRS